MEKHEPADAPGGWQYSLWTGRVGIAAAVAAVGASRANGMRRIALGFTAGVLVLPLLSFGAVLGIARALRTAERETR